VIARRGGGWCPSCALFSPSVMGMRVLLLVASILVFVYSKRYAVYRIIPQTNDSLHFLEGLTKDTGIDFWKEPRAVGQEVHAMIPDPKAGPILDALRSRNITFSLMIQDVEKVIKNQNLARLKLKSERRQKDFRDGKVDFNLAEYHSFADVINYFNALANHISPIHLRPTNWSHSRRKTDSHDQDHEQAIGRTKEGECGSMEGFMRESGSLPLLFSTSSIRLINDTIKIRLFVDT
ncbi:hypothetical protein PENTCL1PPCAC_30710, partial [Pristionchus entomophagus]